MPPSQSQSSTTSIRLNEIIAPKFYEPHKLIKQNAYSNFWFKGGRGSTKSSFIAIQIILGILKDPNANAFVVRKVDATIRLSVLNTLLWAIGTLGVAHLFDFTKAPAEITYKLTGQKIIMKGLDDPLKVKSIKLVKGYFKYLWFEELAEFSGPDEIRSVEQSILRGGDVFVMLASYNPPNDPAAWVNRESEEIVANRFVHSSTYLDVPAEWLGKKFIEDAETLKENNREAYNHEYLGMAVGRAEQIVFFGHWVEKEFETWERARFFFGADWGFASDPTALVRCYIQDDILYVDQEAFGYGVEIDETPQLFKAVPGNDKWPIKADCSRPETISYLRRKGFNIAPADKWTGCVEDGIAHLKGFKKIVVHPRCTNLIREFSLYSYKVDRVTKDILPILVDKHNHGIDALRYALDGYIKSRGSLATWEKLGKR